MASKNRAFTQLELDQLENIIAQHIEALQPEYQPRGELTEYGKGSEPIMGPPMGHYDDIESLLCFICQQTPW